MSAREELPKEELGEELTAAEAPASRLAGQIEVLLHDLQVQKAELEMRNLELRDTGKQLEQSRAHYAELYDYAPIALCTLDIEGRIIHANLAMAAILGCQGTRPERRALTAVVLNEDRSAFRSHLRRCFAEKTRSTVEVRLKLKNLGIVHFQAVSTALVDEAGSVTACKTVFCDVSALKRSEDRLRLLAAAGASLPASFDLQSTLVAALETLVPAVADACFVDVVEHGDERPHRIASVVGDTVRDGAGELLARAPGARLELTEPELATRDGVDLLSQMLADTPERAALLDALGSKSVVAAPIRIRDTLVGRLALISCTEGRQYTSVDVTFAVELAARIAMAVDNARRYQEAQRAIEARQELMSIVSHDLKSPITAILLSAESLLAAAPANDRRKGSNAIERIKVAARRIEHILGDLNDVNSIEHGHLSVSPTTQAVPILIADAIEQLAPIARQKEVTVTTAHQPGAEWASCDPQRVLQVLVNLLDNAIKFTGRGGAVSVNADLFEGCVRISIHDNGAGMPAATLRNLFQRVWSPKDTKRNGRGLGLFISKGIVESLGGTIWVESKVSAGTTVHFTLPVAKGPAQSASASERTVLVVEHEAGLRDAIREALVGEHACRVAVAADGSEALAYLHGEGAKPALMVLDAQLPGMTARELMTALRAEPRYADLPVALLSDSAEVDSELHSLGTVTAPRKPLDVGQLLAAVEARPPALRASPAPGWEPVSAAGNG